MMTDVRHPCAELNMNKSVPCHSVINCVSRSLETNMLVHLSKTSPYLWLVTMHLADGESNAFLSSDISLGPIEQANRMASAPTKRLFPYLDLKESFPKVDHRLPSTPSSLRFSFPANSYTPETAGTRRSPIG